MPAFRAASSGERRPLVAARPAPLDPVFERRLNLDTGDHDLERLIFLCKPLVDALVAELSAAASAAARLDCHLSLDDRSHARVAISPAAPTLDVVQLVTLLRLRLSATSFSARVRGGGRRPHPSPRPGDAAAVRDAHAGAISRRPPRRWHGSRRCSATTAVVRARLSDAHLPRARVIWEPVRVLADRRPGAAAAAARRLVRRLLTRPLRVSGATDARRRDWLQGALDDGRVDASPAPLRHRRLVARRASSATTTSFTRAAGGAGCTSTMSRARGFSKARVE